MENIHKKKIIIFIVLLILIISFISSQIETNYCHYLTTTPPIDSPLNYIKPGIWCEINSYIAVPGIILHLTWKAFINLF